MKTFWIASFFALQALPAFANTTPTGLALNDRYKNLELFQKILSFVEKNYVDSVKNDELMTGAIKGMLETLDPHSNFLTPEVFRDVKIDTSGKFAGVGIEVVVKDEVLTVLAPMEESPAWKAGIQAGDKIVKINGESTKGYTLSEAVLRMRGKNGTPVTFTIYRKGWKQFKNITVKRDMVKVIAVKSDEIEPGYGYIRLAQFSETAGKECLSALEKLEKKNGGKEKLKGLVFDLRTNPGGLLDQAVDVVSLFLDEGAVVSTMGRDPNQKDIRYAKKGLARKDLPVVVLVNSSTASAAEIVAAALQDHHRAMIIGDTTFGKGSVQTIIDLGNELGLKLTIARYFTPNGVSIQEKGVVPDIFLEEYDPKLLAKAKIKRDSTREKDLRGHLINKQSGTNKDEFNVQELSDKVAGLKSGDSAKLDDETLDMTPVAFNSKEDIQVSQALKYLKSYEVFKKIKKQ